MPNPCSLIAFLTDFGTRDHYVGAIKAAVYKVAPEVKLIDISHEVAPQDIAQAAFILRLTYHDYPRGTVFAAVVDPGVGTSRKAILLCTENYLFIGPDNGIFSFVLEQKQITAAYELNKSDFFADHVSSTFHGRDIFAPCAAHLAAGVSPSELGSILNSPLVQLQEIMPQFGHECISGSFLHCDHFGNLISNVHKDDASKWQLKAQKQSFQIKLDGRELTLCSTYQEGRNHELFALWGSSGFLEVSRADSAASDLIKDYRSCRLNLC